MRDAFGSTFMFRLIIIFIVFYVAFATIAVSYAKTFRLKNSVIDAIEQQQLTFSKNSNAFVPVDNILNASGYNFSNASTRRKLNKICKKLANNGEEGIGSSMSNTYYLSSNGACIIPNKYDKSHYYYQVILVMVIKFPVFGREFVIPVPGDTEDFTYDYRID